MLKIIFKKIITSHFQISFSDKAIIQTQKTMIKLRTINYKIEFKD